MMSKSIQYICVIFAFCFFSLPIHPAEMAPLKLEKTITEKSFDKYNTPILATNTLILENFDTLATDLNKELLYDMVFASSETFSNPLIQLLISDDRALEDNKSYADAISRGKTPSWRQDLRFKTYYDEAKQNLNSSGNISPSLLMKI